MFSGNASEGDNFHSDVTSAVNDWEHPIVANVKKLIQVLKLATVNLDKKPSLKNEMNESHQIRRSKFRKRLAEWSNLIDYKMSDDYDLFSNETGNRIYSWDKKAIKSIKSFLDCDFYELPNTILESCVICPMEAGPYESQDYMTCIEIILLSGATITPYTIRNCGFDMNVLGEISIKTLSQFQLKFCDVCPSRRVELWFENDVVQKIIDNNCDADFVHNLFKQTCCTEWNDEIETKYKETRSVDEDGSISYQFLTF